ncbi:RidA family protein [Streptomyces globisporus]|uniref:RidA family protein n=1 Tax=Streptomyces globisporus TaxID=1908 RepID=UPI0037BD1E8E
MVLRHTNPDGLHNAPDLITQAITVEDLGLVYLSGQVAWNAAGEVVGGDHARQMAQIVENIDLALAAAGTSRDHLVKETIYVVGYRPELVATLLGPLRSNGGKPPASSLIGVQCLALPDCLVEVDVIARIEPA